DSTRILYVSDHGDNMGERGLWGKSTLYEESAGIPMIAAGPGIPAGRVSTTPVSLVDVYPTVIDALDVAADGAERPGRSLLEIANNPDDPERVVYAEYHAAGATCGAFMIRRGQWKLCYYIDMPPQLFDLAADPEELRDLGKSPDHADTRASLEADLRRVCDPEEVDRRARRDQAAIVEANGGREKVVARGGFGATPPPGEAPQFTAAG
ncbi:MAG: sulfatase-like hydrolase/transferase, partial [Rhodospirillales bacterium]